MEIKYTGGFWINRVAVEVEHPNKGDYHSMLSALNVIILHKLSCK